MADAVYPAHEFAYDPACETLARHFLPETWTIERERAVQELAQKIQEEIEAWLDEHGFNG